MFLGQEAGALPNLPGMDKGPLMVSMPESDSTFSGAISSASIDARSLYCLVLVDEETGQPQRVATELEAELVARSLHKDATNSSLPCLRAVSESVSASSDSDSGTPRYVGHLAKHGGPCQHCGTSAVSDWPTRMFLTTMSRNRPKPLTSNYFIIVPG